LKHKTLTTFSMTFGQSCCLLADSAWRAVAAAVVDSFSVHASPCRAWWETNCTKPNSRS
jgi:hypothetical protein